MRRSPLSVLFLALSLVTAGFVAGFIAWSQIAARTPGPDEATSAPPSLTTAQFPGAAQPSTSRPAASLPPAGTLPDLSNVAEAALNVAANISSTSIVARALPWPFSFQGGAQFEPAETLGSGVIVSSDGLIVTNAHVITGAGGRVTDVKVTLRDGRERPARVVGLDTLSDLAVLKVEAKGLPTLPWGDSSKLRHAEWVLAIGNPYQLNGTVTLGIVSAPSRSQSGAYTDFIQTDAAINRGNSGGALVNARGELVGINSMIFSESGGSVGLGFAIPSNTAREVVDELVTHGAVPWGSVGTITLLDQATLRQGGYDASGLSGLYVYRLNPNSAAARAGLRRGDIIVSINGQRTLERGTFETSVAKAKPGDRVRLEIERNGQRQTLNVTVESRAQQTQAQPAPGR